MGNDSNEMGPTDALSLQDMGIGISATPATLQEATTRLANFKKFASDTLIEGQDYGVIPGTGKRKQDADGNWKNDPTSTKSLLKPGAEKICQLYGLTASFEYLEKTVDWSRTPPFFYYEIRCTLTHRTTGVILGEGLGSCNSKESRYRYRWVYSQDRPAEEGWEKYYKKWRKRIENLDTADQANTILKISKKRAFIDATLTVTAASDLFSQDLEDYDENTGPREPKSQDVNKKAGAAGGNLSEGDENKLKFYRGLFERAPTMDDVDRHVKVLNNNGKRVLPFLTDEIEKARERLGAPTAPDKPIEADFDKSERGDLL